MKKKIIFAGIAYIALLVAITIGISVKSNFASVTPSETLNGLPVYYNHAVYALDTSTPEKAYGASKYAFIAKINSILRTEYVNPTEIETGLGKTKTVYDPITVYSISVIQNIKGELITSEPIELMQNGGISKDGESYVFMENSKFLNVGEYYMILTGAIDDGGVLEATNPDRIVSLGSDLDFIKTVQSGKTTSTMRESKVTSKLVKTIENYMSASKNEVKPKTLFETSAKVPVLDNVSKYDVNYKKKY